jgi:hypothetical protein
VEVLPRFYREGRLENEPLRMVAKDGRILDVQLSSAGTFDEKGRFLRSLAAIKDVTAERRVAAQPRRHAATLEALLPLQPHARGRAWPRSPVSCWSGPWP